MSVEALKLVSFTPEGFAGFLNVLHRTYGTAGNAMIYNMSENYGKNRVENLLPVLPADQDERLAALRLLGERRFVRQGWGKLTIEELDTETGTIDVLLEDQPFSDCKGTSEAPSCIFLRGVIAGLLSAVLEKELRVKAVDCPMNENNAYRYVYNIL